MLFPKAGNTYPCQNGVDCPDIGDAEKEAAWDALRCWLGKWEDGFQMFAPDMGNQGRGFDGGGPYLWVRHFSQEGCELEPRKIYLLSPDDFTRLKGDKGDNATVENLGKQVKIGDCNLVVTPMQAKFDFGDVTDPIEIDKDVGVNQELRNSRLEVEIELPNCYNGGVELEILHRANYANTNPSENANRDAIDIHSEYRVGNGAGGYGAWTNFYETTLLNFMTMGHRHDDNTSASPIDRFNSTNHVAQKGFIPDAGSGLTKIQFRMRMGSERTMETDSGIWRVSRQQGHIAYIVKWIETRCCA